MRETNIDLDRSVSKKAALRVKVQASVSTHFDAWNRKTSWHTSPQTYDLVWLTCNPPESSPKRVALKQLQDSQNIAGI